jgi:hypothetical protein
MTINNIMREASPLHTGEVVGSIPTAPTIKTGLREPVVQPALAIARQLMEERRMNEADIYVQNPCRMFT